MLSQLIGRNLIQEILTTPKWIKTDLILIKSLESVNNQIQQSREKDEKESSNFLY